MERKLNKVSVVIPCFNQGQYVDDAVNSVLKQTYQDFEIIIVNDGSTDQFTSNKLKNYDQPRTQVIHTHNLGLSAARNNGIKAANGEYILVLDADDTFEPSFLEKAVLHLEKEETIGVVTCGIKSFGRENWTAYPTGGDVTAFLLKSNSCGNALFRKICWEEAEGYDENMKDGYEDWNFWIAVTKRGWKVYSIPELLFNYRTSKTSMYRESYKKNAEIRRQIVINHKEVFQDHVENIIFEMTKIKEKEIQEILDSKSYKLGRFILSPFVKVFGRLKTRK